MGENVHKNHRQRVFAKFDENGFNGMNEHEILEMLLFYGIPRVDTNEIAHNLLNEFGPTIGDVLHTPKNKLKKVKGIADNSARFLNVLGAMYDHILKAVPKTKLTPETSAGIFREIFDGKFREEFYIICLNPKNEILCIKKLTQGSFETTEIDIANAIRTALAYDSAKVVFAHNHPSGITRASNADITVTSMLEGAMHLIGVKMLDHIIYADGECISITKNYSIRKDRSLEKGIRERHGG